MKPIAIVAFIAALGTPAPRPEACSRKDNNTAQAAKPMKQDPGQGTAKRGGWDHN